MNINEAQQIARGVLQAFVGPDEKVSDMTGLYGAIVQALMAAHEAGWRDRGHAERID